MNIDCKKWLDAVFSNNFVKETAELIKTNQDCIDVVDENGKNSLHLVIESRNTENYKIERVEYLIENGAILDGIDDAGMTPLMLAVKENLSEIVKILIKRGADPEQKDLSGLNSFLISSKYSAYTAMLVLIENKIQKDIRDYSGMSIWDYLWVGSEKAKNNSDFKKYEDYKKIIYFCLKDPELYFLLKNDEELFEKFGAHKTEMVEFYKSQVKKGENYSLF